MDAGDIFDGNADVSPEEEEEEEDFPAPLPDLPEDFGSETAPPDNADEGDAKSQQILAKGATKKVVRKPQPKLDSLRLTGDRGIAILPKIFEEVKFRGKGYEKEDLTTIMKTLEHWGHRLFPKMPFTDLLQKVEKLGNKKDVQTCIKRIRLDMPVLSEDFLSKEDDDDDAVIRRDSQNDDKEMLNVDAEDAWEQMLNEQRDQDRQASLVSVTADGGTGFVSDTQVSTQTSLTKDQLEKIERNRRLAMEKREMKLSLQTPSGSESVVNEQVSAGNLLDVDVQMMLSSQVDETVSVPDTSSVLQDSQENKENISSYSQTQETENLDSKTSLCAESRCQN